MQERRPITTPISHVPILFPAIFYDDCAGTFNYQDSGDGADYAAAYNSAYAYVGEKGIQLRTRTTTPASGDVVSITKSIPLPPTQLLRVQLNFATLVTTRQPNIYVALLYYDGSSVNAPELAFTPADSKVYYAASFRSDYTDTGLTYNPVQNNWNHLDFSVNLSAGKYHNLTVNNGIADLSTISVPTSADATAAILKLFLEIETRTASYYYAGLDQILVTTENP